METSYYLTCRSLTYAQKVSKALTAARLRNILIRTPQNMSREGCGYAVRVSSAVLSDALNTLAVSGLPPKRVYRVTPAGAYEEVPF